MSKIAMPSPRGTNHAGLYITSRVHAAYDAAPDDSPADASALMDDDGKPHADSQQAHRILSGIIDRLSKSDMTDVMGMMKEAGLLKDEEVRAIEEGMNGESEDPDMASDAAIKAHRRKLYDSGLLSYDQLRAPIQRPQSAAERADMLKRFPHSNRLK